MRIDVTEILDSKVVELLRGNMDVVDNQCGDSPRRFDFSNYSPDQLLTKTLYIPLFMTNQEDDMGYYECMGETGETLEYQVEITGETLSRAYEVQNYQGQFVVGLNFAEYPEFTGVLGVDGDIVTYVIGGTYQGGYVSGTGVLYVTDTSNGNTYFMASQQRQLEGCGWYKDNSLFGYTGNATRNNVFIERNPVVSVNEMLFKMMEMKSSADFDDSSYTTIKTY